MRKRIPSLGVTNVLLGALVIALMLNPFGAGATHQPANKVVASGSKIAVVPAPLVAGPGGTELLSATFKTSAPTDLMMHVTLECSILTRVRTGTNQQGGTSTAEAEGQIRVWLEFDGSIVPINTISTNPQPHDPTSPGEDSDKVTFCNREHRQSLTDTEEPRDGTDTLETFLRTKDANAFNWVYLNTGNGIHTLKVKADLNTEVSGDATAEGFVGNRTLIVEPTKMSNHASV